MNPLLLVVNAGSSSIKFTLYEVDDRDRLFVEAKGEIDGIGTLPQFIVKSPGGKQLVRGTFSVNEINRHVDAIRVVNNWLFDYCNKRKLVAVGHRVVHGGSQFFEPLLLDEELMTQLEALVPLAPLHQPQQLSVIRAITAAVPSLPQIVCFDTAFHHTQSAIAQTFAIPRYLTEKGVRRYGFHGLSYEYVASLLPGLAPELSEARVIVAHLGNGASLCAMQHGRCVATTMGFSTLDGLVMGTRPGDLDPGVLLYLMDQYRMDARGLEKLLYEESGLKGVSGLSSDMRMLLASDAPEAKEAIALFVHRAKLEIGAMTAALGGLDALVFTGGIGERSAVIRALICQDAAWLGVRLDPSANEQNRTRLFLPESKVSVWTVATDENLMIARHTWRQLSKIDAARTDKSSEKLRRGKNQKNPSDNTRKSSGILHEVKN